MEDGIPADAFALGITGDDREAAKRFRAQNRQERRELRGERRRTRWAFQVTVYRDLDGAVRWTNT